MYPRANQGLKSVYQMHMAPVGRMGGTHSVAWREQADPCMALPPPTQVLSRYTVSVLLYIFYTVYTARRIFLVYRIGISITGKELSDVVCGRTPTR